MSTVDAVEIELAGKTLRITSPDKVFFSKNGETKLDLIQYYAAVGEPMMGVVQGRPAMMQRFPDGASGKSFWQKRVPKGAPDWLQTTTVSTPNGTDSEAIVLADVAHVAWAVHMGSLCFHVWPYPAARPDIADELRIDLDPHGNITFGDIRWAAHRVREFFAELGLTSWVKTTGSKGLHVFVKLALQWDSYQVRAAAVALGPRARAPSSRPAHRRLVEGRARRSRLHRLQPERAAQDGVRRLVGATTGRRAGVDADSLERRRRGRARRSHDRNGAGDPAGAGRRLVRLPGCGPVARTAARVPRARHGGRSDGRALAARVPQAAERASSGGAESGQEGRRRFMNLVDAEVIDDPADERMRIFLGLADQALRQVREAPGGDMHGVFIAEGDLVIQRALDAGHRLHSVIVEAARSRALEFELGRTPLYRMGEPVVQAIASHRRYRGSMAAFHRPAPADLATVLAGARTAIITEGVNNPTNLGMMVRTAAALGVDALLVDPTSCDPLARRACRVSMGAVFAVPHAWLDPLPEGLDAVNEAGFATIALTPDPAARPLDELTFGADERVALLLGAEEPGLTEETMQRATHRARIPMHHGIDSLNVATAAAIAMWHVTRRSG